MSNTAIELASWESGLAERQVIALESIAKSLEKLTSPQVVVNVPATGLGSDEAVWAVDRARQLQDELS